MEAIKAAGKKNVPIMVSYEGDCPSHGHYRSFRVHINGTVVTDSGCPACSKLREEEKSKAAAEMQERERVAKAKDILQRKLQQADVPAGLVDKTLANFIDETDNQKAAKALAARFVAGWDKAKQGGYGLYFYGEPGTGKTHLACAALQALLPKTDGLYVLAEDIVRTVCDTWNEAGKSKMTEKEAIALYSQVGLLVIDELGMGTNKPNELRILFSIIDGRYRAKLPTIVASNIPGSRLSSYVGKRIASRVQEKCVPFHFTCASMRQEPGAEVFG